MKFLTFGEIMLRLKAPGQECFFQSPMFEATFGGGEANVAVSLANYGEDAAFLTVLPDNAIALSLTAGVMPVMWNHSTPSKALSQSISPGLASAMADHARS